MFNTSAVGIDYSGPQVDRAFIEALADLHQQHPLLPRAFSLALQTGKLPRNRRERRQGRR